MLASILVAVAQIAANIPAWAEAGIEVAGLIQWCREQLDREAAPGNAEWDRLDAFVKEWKAKFDAAAAS